MKKILVMLLSALTISCFAPQMSTANGYSLLGYDFMSASLDPRFTREIYQNSTIDNYDLIAYDNDFVPTTYHSQFVTSTVVSPHLPADLIVIGRLFDPNRSDLYDYLLKEGNDVQLIAQHVAELTILGGPDIMPPELRDRYVGIVVNRPFQEEAYTAMLGEGLRVGPVKTGKEAQTVILVDEKTQSFRTALEERRFCASDRTGAWAYLEAHDEGAKGSSPWTLMGDYFGSGKIVGFHVRAFGAGVKVKRIEFMVVDQNYRNNQVIGSSELTRTYEDYMYSEALSMYGDAWLVIDRKPGWRAVLACVTLENGQVVLTSPIFFQPRTED